jgi:hypothetical protein
VNAEQGRVTELARQFFALVANARHMTPSQIEGMQAAIYLGKRAQKAGLLDGVMGFDELISTLQARAPKAPLDNATVSDPPSTPHRHSYLSDAGARAMLTLDAKIIKLEAAIAAGGDPKALRAKLAVLMAAKAEMDDDDDGGPPKKKDDDGDDEDSKAEKARAKADKAKRDAEAAKHRAKAEEHRAKAEESEEAAKQCEAEDDGGGEDAKAIRRAPGPSALTPGAAAAIAAQGEIGREALSRIAKLEKAAEARELSALVNDARAARRITPGEAKTLASKPASFVRDFLEMRPRPLVATDEEMLSQPDTTPAGDIPANVKRIVEQAVSAMNLTGEQADKFREQSYADHRKALSGSAGVH